MCRDRNMIWTSEFVSLGISFKVNKLNEITEYNMETKIGEIDKLI